MQAQAEPARVEIVNRLEMRCAPMRPPGGNRRMWYEASFRLLGADRDWHDAGGVALTVRHPDDPRPARHYYFSQEQRIRIGLFLLAGVPLANLSLAFADGEPDWVGRGDFTKEEPRALGGVVESELLRQRRQEPEPPPV